MICLFVAIIRAPSSRAAARKVMAGYKREKKTFLDFVLLLCIVKGQVLFVRRLRTLSALHHLFSLFFSQCTINCVYFPPPTNLLKKEEKKTKHERLLDHLPHARLHTQENIAALSLFLFFSSSLFLVLNMRRDRNRDTPWCL